MTVFITEAARLYVEAVDKEYLESDLEPDQLKVVNDELDSLRISMGGRHARAERGRIACELFGFNDDNETIASDVIADILHWVALTSGDDAVALALFRATKYYTEELR